MASSLLCQSCQRPVPDDPTSHGVVDLVHAPPEVARHWPTNSAGRPGAIFCVSCLLRATLRLFGPSARREPLAIDADLPVLCLAAPLAQGT